MGVPPCIGISDRFRLGEPLNNTNSQQLMTGSDQVIRFDESCGSCGTSREVEITSLRFAKVSDFDSDGKSGVRLFYLTRTVALPPPPLLFVL